MQPKYSPSEASSGGRGRRQEEAVCSGLENRMSIFDSFHGTLELVCWKSGIWAAGSWLGSGSAWLGEVAGLGWGGLCGLVPFVELVFDDVEDKRGP